MRLSKLEYVILPLLVALGYGLITLLFQRLGFFGLGLLGLVIGFVSVMVELESDGPVGGNQTINLFSQNFHGRLLQSRSERDERHREKNQLYFATSIAKIISSGLIIIGFGCFYFYQLGV